MIEGNSREEKMELARRRVKEKLGFIRHFIIYIVVIGFLVMVNNLTYGGYQWWPWPAMGWGIGVIAHFLSAFLFQGGGSLEERLMKREIDRMDDQ